MDNLSIPTNGLPGRGNDQENIVSRFHSANDVSFLYLTLELSGWRRVRDRKKHDQRKEDHTGQLEHYYRQSSPHLG